MQSLAGVRGQVPELDGAGHAWVDGRRVEVHLVWAEVVVPVPQVPAFVEDRAHLALAPGRPPLAVLVVAGRAGCALGRHHDGRGLPAGGDRGHPSRPARHHPRVAPASGQEP